jgi:2-polyprenylphenol 6-hydroxylase
MTRARVVVAGGGPVGMAFACACSSCDVTVVEAAPAPPIALPEGFDVRTFALSSGTRTFLRDAGAWDHLDGRRIAAVRRMEVFGDAGAALSFGAPAGGSLAWIVEAGRLARALDELAASLAHVTVVRGRSAVGFEASAEGVRLRLDGGETIEADLLVGADGPDSRVRAGVGLPTEETTYGEEALVANFATERAHGGIARKWFRSDGVLAWLPLPGNAVSIVWSAPSAYAGELAGLDAAALEERVREAGHGALGALRLLSTVARFPLRLITVDRTVAPGMALIGDAAHAVHPLAGQGVNLGFQDARILAEALAARSPLERAGDLRVLRGYARARREDVSAMQFVTDRLDRLFASDAPGASWLRNTGLRVVDSQSWAKRALTGRAMR